MKPLAPNKTLQRSGAVSALGRGAAERRDRTRALARPRAKRPACRR